MKRTIAAILAVSPVLLHAQVKSSAQPSSTPILQSSVVQPASLAGVHPLDHVVLIPAAPVRISTGIIVPKIIHSVAIAPDRITLPWGDMGRDRTVVVAMTVDKNGTPSNLKVVKSADMVTDSSVLAAVKQYRFQPATLDGQPIPIELALSYTIK